MRTSSCTMHTLIVVSVIIAIIALADAEGTLKNVKFSRIQSATPRSLESRPFSVKLNHFAPLDNRIANFTYTQKLDYYRPNGPIFIYINDAGEFTTEFLEIGLMHDIAIDAGAALITADNRFFRSNLPTEDASLENLQYLTIEQMINDIARLIEVVKQDLAAPEARVILWGSGFGATLATWTKKKFSHLVNGVWSSSGIYEHVPHTNEPYEQLTRTLTSVGGQECADDVFHTFETMEIMMFRTNEFFLLSDRLGSCYFPVSYVDADVAAWFAGLAKLIIDYINIHHREGAASFCAAFRATDLPEFEVFAQWMRRVYTGENCLDISYFTHAWQSSITSWPDIAYLNWGETNIQVYPFVSRPLFYLHCTQIGMFPTSVNARSSFSTAVGQDTYFFGCNEAFGDGYDYMLLADNVERLNFQYGGKNPAVSNVLFTNGELDTNFAFGVTVNNEELGMFVRNIPDHAKSADLWSVSQEDSAELASTKEQIRQLVLEWSGV